MYPKVRFTETIDHVLDDPEVGGVAIATPAETHGELVRRALLAGKDVLVEKHLCLSVKEGQKLVALAVERRRVLVVGHLLWYHPAVLRLKELVEEGELGRIQYIYSNRLNLGKIRREENILWSFAPHDISIIFGRIGEMPDAVDAHGGNFIHDRITGVTLFLILSQWPKSSCFRLVAPPVQRAKIGRYWGSQDGAVFDDVERENKLLLYPHVIN